MKKLFTAALILFTSSAWANFQSDLLKSKKGKHSATNSAGESTQWTLADWLSQKNKVRLMDQWLAAHTRSPWFDFNMRASTQSYTYKVTNETTSTHTTQNSMNYQADFNMWVLNFNGEYQKTNDAKESNGGSAGLRLLGASAQSTSLLARYGWRKMNDLATHEVWENQYIEGELQLYIVDQFGVDGKCRHYLPGKSNLGSSLEGHQATAGVFLESSFLRIFADYFQEPLSFTSGGVVTRRNSDGFSAGAKIFF